MNQQNELNRRSNIIIYTTEDGLAKIETTFDEETVWLSKAQIAELFQRDRSVINRHIRNVFEEGELIEKSNVQKMHIANSDKPVEYFNLDVIISVGYRVKSKRGGKRLFEYHQTAGAEGRAKVSEIPEGALP